MIIKPGNKIVGRLHWGKPFGLWFRLDSFKAAVIGNAILLVSALVICAVVVLKVVA